MAFFIRRLEGDWFLVTKFTDGKILTERIFVE